MDEGLDLTERERRTERRDKRVKDWIILSIGVLIALNEAFRVAEPRPSMILLAAGIFGIPLVMAADEKRR